MPQFEHIARPGDHLSRIARENSFWGYPPVWNDPANEGLRETRHTPHILATGDRVVIPPLEGREANRSTGQRHRFVADRPALVLRIDLEGADHRKTKLGDLTVRLDGQPTTPAKAGDGTLEIPIDPLTDRCTIQLGGRIIAGRIGFLEPVATLAGYRERLNNLGYRAGESNDATDVRLRSAIEEFQCDQGLGVDGHCGPKTQRALVDGHGC